MKEDLVVFYRPFLQCSSPERHSYMIINILNNGRFQSNQTIILVPLLILFSSMGFKHKILQWTLSRFET